MNTITNRLTSPSAHSLARVLGGFSVVLGLAQLLAPRRMAQRAGMKGGAGMMRLSGLREIINGAGLLLATDPRPWVEARVAGDALDLSTLLAGLRMPSGDRTRPLVSLLAVAGITAADVAVLRGLRREARQEQARHYHYADRSGLPSAPELMRGAAATLQVPPDMKPPFALQPFNSLH